MSTKRAIYTFTQVVVFALAVLIEPDVGRAQNPAEADSLVAEFLEHGAVSSWMPFEIFRNCPDLDATQERAFHLLLNAELSEERLGDLATAWMISLRGCQDPRLIQWYFDRLGEGIAAGEDPDDLILL